MKRFIIILSLMLAAAPAVAQRGERDQKGFGPAALLGVGFVFGYTGRRHPILPLTLPALIGALAGAGLAKRSLPAGEQ